MNPLLSMLGIGGNQPSGNTPQNNNFTKNLNTVLGLYSAFKQSGNPTEMLQQMAQTNPDVANTLNYIQSNGGDMNAIANDLASKNGLSLPFILNLFK